MRKLEKCTNPPYDQVWLLIIYFLYFFNILIVESKKKKVIYRTVCKCPVCSKTRYVSRMYEKASRSCAGKERLCTVGTSSK